MAELRFRKRKLDDTPYEACSVFDVNNDGIPDIVSGAYRYEGPDFTAKHKISDIGEIGEYTDDFSLPLDVDGGRLDGYRDGFFLQRFLEMAPQAAYARNGYVKIIHYWQVLTW